MTFQKKRHDFIKKKGIPFQNTGITIQKAGFTFQNDRRRTFNAVCPRRNKIENSKNMEDLRNVSK